MEISSEKVLYRKKVLVTYKILLILAIIMFVVAIGFLITMIATLTRFDEMARQSADWLRDNYNSEYSEYYQWDQFVGYGEYKFDWSRYYADRWKDFWAGKHIELEGAGFFACSSFWVWFGLAVGLPVLGGILLLAYLFTKVRSQLVLTDSRIITNVQRGRFSNEHNIMLEHITSFELANRANTKCGDIALHTSNGNMTFSITDTTFYDILVEAINNSHKK